MNDPIPRGYQRLPGTIHLHVDGGAQRDLVQQVLSTYGGKLQEIVQFVSGPQRVELPTVYRGHTPGSLEQEAFEFFSTTSIHSRNHAIETVRSLYPRLISYPGIIVELERVVLSGTSKGWEEVPFDTVLPLTLEEISHQQSYTLPIEIHHGINIPKERTHMVSSFELSSLLSLSKDLGLNVGGWFLFEKDDTWAFRSNEFVEMEKYQELACRQHDALEEYLKKSGRKYELWTIAEQVLGLWRT